MRGLASAPGKIILFGEHAINRQQAGISAAVDRRAYALVTLAGSDVELVFRAEGQRLTWEGIGEFRARVDALRTHHDLYGIRDLVRGDFFAPAKYVLSLLRERLGYDGGCRVEWRSALPMGSGMGSGAAASAAMIGAFATALGRDLPPVEVAHLAWQGDILAHGGVASALDSSACALGGCVLVSTSWPPRTLSGVLELPIVVGDTGVRASTGEVNTRVREALQSRLHLGMLFEEIGLLVERAVPALERGDLQVVGRLMHMNHLLLRELGVSCPELERLVEAALSAGAWGAKLSGSGGGGIMVAVAPGDRVAEVACALEGAGGRPMALRVGVEGVRSEPVELWDKLGEEMLQHADSER